MDERVNRPATPDEIVQTLSFALQFDGRKATRQGSGFMAQLTAEHLLGRMESAGFILLKRPPAQPYSAPFSAPPLDEQPLRVRDETPEEIIKEMREALSSALRYNDRTQTHIRDDVGANITSDRLIKALLYSGFVISKQPPTNT